MCCLAHTVGQGSENGGLPVLGRGNMDACGGYNSKGGGETKEKPKGMAQTYYLYLKGEEGFTKNMN